MSSKQDEFAEEFERAKQAIDDWVTERADVLLDAQEAQRDTDDDEGSSFATDLEDWEPDPS